MLHFSEIVVTDSPIPVTGNFTFTPKRPNAFVMKLDCESAFHLILVDIAMCIMIAVDKNVYETFSDSKQ